MSSNFSYFRFIECDKQGRRRRAINREWAGIASHKEDWRPTARIEVKKTQIRRRNRSIERCLIGMITKEFLGFRMYVWNH